MLTKQTGASLVTIATASSSIIYVTNYDASTVRKVRVATTSNGVLIALTTSSNLSGAGILVPPQSAEHFSLEGSDHIHVVRTQAGGDAYISVTPIA